MKAHTTLGRSCLLWHRWRTVLVDEGNVYRECKDCTRREVLGPDDPDFKIDWDWLMHNTSTPRPYEPLSLPIQFNEKEK